MKRLYILLLIGLLILLVLAKVFRAPMYWVFLL